MSDKPKEGESDKKSDKPKSPTGDKPTLPPSTSTASSASATTTTTTTAKTTTADDTKTNLATSEKKSPIAENKEIKPQSETKNDTKDPSPIKPTTPTDNKKSPEKTDEKKTQDESNFVPGDKAPLAEGEKLPLAIESQTQKEKTETNEAAKLKEDTVSTATTKAAEEKFTEDMGINARLSFAVCAAAFGSAFQHGYNLGVINAPLKLIEDWMNTTSYERSEEYITQTEQTMITSWIVSIYCIGGMVGGGLTGFFSERYGRKGGLLLNNITAILAAIFFGFCKMASSWEMIIIGRFLIGINNGLNAGLAPMYLSEIAPTSLRGAIGTVYQLVVTISILFSQVMGLESLLGTEDLWPILLALTILPAIFQLCTLPICPESPKFLLINKEKRIEAQRALSWLRDSSNIHEELEEMQNEAEAQKLVPRVSLREILTNPALRIPLVIAMMMMIAQQLSGINAAIFFSVKIYEQAGLNEDESLYATIAMGTMNVLMTFVSLVLVEKAGRKTLMLIGLSGMMIDTILLTLCLVLQSESARWLSYASIVLVILFVVMFATGPGSIPWFLVNELFASNARPMASSIAVLINWTAAFIVGLGFLPIQQALGPYVFLVFTVLLAMFIAFTIKKVPETKGKSIDEITAVFKQQAYGGGINRV